MTVGEIMTRSPMTAESTTTVGEALGLLYELDVRHLPVVDEGRLVGMISDRDLRTLLGPSFRLGVAKTDVLERPIGPLMSSDVRSVDPETELSEAIDIMLDNRVGALAVTSAEDDQLVGIVSYVDILRAAQPLL